MGNLGSICLSSSHVKAASHISLNPMNLINFGGGVLMPPFWWLFFGGQNENKLCIQAQINEEFCWNIIKKALSDDCLTLFIVCTVEKIHKSEYAYMHEVSWS